MSNKKEVMSLAIKVIGSKEGAKIWMKTPQVALNNKKPIECLKNANDINNVDDLYNVINLLNAMENGVYL